MRTVEVLFVIIIILGAFMLASQFAVLPSPRQIYGTNLRELAQSTLETLDTKGILTEAVFKPPSDPSWGDLQRALSASLPPNIVYNLSVLDISTPSNGIVDYQLLKSISDTSSFGVDSEAASLLLTSPSVTFSMTPERIGGEDPITLYILNCEDANGWWITGYTGQSLASDFYNLLSPYFGTTVLVNTTEQLGLLLDNSTQIEGTIQNAVVVNTFGEAVPIPTEYCEGGSEQSEGYQGGSYAKYCYTLGAKTRLYNWTWISIVGYPVYYVTNTATFADDDNSWGIYGMKHVGSAGLNAFLKGLDNWGYAYDGEWIMGNPGDVKFNSEAIDASNYYGVYPSPNQTSTRALPSTILSTYHLAATEVFNRPSPPDQNYIAAATYRHTGGGAFTAIGLTRIPDIRVSAVALLMYYRPAIYRSEFGPSGTSRLVTLQLSQQGGI